MSFLLIPLLIIGLIIANRWLNTKKEACFLMNDIFKDELLFFKLSRVLIKLNT